MPTRELVPGVSGVGGVGERVFCLWGVVVVVLRSRLEAACAVCSVEGVASRPRQRWRLRQAETRIGSAT